MHPITSEEYIMKVLYIGRFELPDKEATANRVVANARLLRDLGHEVVLAGWSTEVEFSEIWKQNEYFGFNCFEKHKAENAYDKTLMFLSAYPEIDLLKKCPFDLVIAYDFPAVALKKIIKYCRYHKIKCVCDVSEWYTNSNKNPLFRFVRAYDSHLRMKVLHKKVDGLIVISKFLQNYYLGQKMVLIPPLVDKRDSKWQLNKSLKDNMVRFVYAGWPSKTKERLDLLVSCIEELAIKFCLQLDVYGINEKEYRKIYEIDKNLSISSSVIFHGRVTHLETLQAVKDADYSLIIRESNRKNNAGFPSKLVESISCGTPVLTTDISNVKDYVGAGENGYIISIPTLYRDLEDAIQKKELVNVNSELFDYRQYIQSMQNFLHDVNNN